jgi:hypothetical protein
MNNDPIQVKNTEDLISILDLNQKRVAKVTHSRTLMVITITMVSRFSSFYRAEIATVREIS